MGLFTKLKKKLLGPPATAGYKTIQDRAYTYVRDLPLFTFDTIRYMLVDPTLRLGLAMRAAPLHGCEFAYKVIGPDGQAKWIPGIQGENPAVNRFVMQQLRRIWRFDLEKLLIGQIWGWSAGEVTYELRDGMVSVDRILSRHARDSFALRSRETGQIHGVRFKRIGGQNGLADLYFPQAFWHAFKPEAESPYGTSIFKGAHSPWADKWLNGGALDVRRLFAHKDAYGGVDIGFPAGTINIDGKGEVPNRDVARAMAEQIKAGGVVTRPSERDSNGNERWPIQRATVPANPTHIFEYPKDLDTEMLRGIEIPDDVITAEATGAWQGKQVPMQAFYTAADMWLADVVQAIATQILEPLVLINWGEKIPFEVQTKPLAEQVMDQINSAEEPGEAPGTPGPTTTAPPRRPASQLIDENGANNRNGFGQSSPVGVRRFSLTDDRTAAELLVGQGVVDAASLVRAGRDYLSRKINGVKRLASSNGNGSST